VGKGSIAERNAGGLLLGLSRTLHVFGSGAPRPFRNPISTTGDVAIMEFRENEQEKACSLTSEHVISDSSTAEKISELMLAFSKKLEDSAELVHSTCSMDEWKAYKKAAAGIYFEMFVSVLEPLYKKHPSLKPPDWD
jgi:hypothetical protein